MAQATIPVTVSTGPDLIQTVAAITSKGKEVTLTALLPDGAIVQVTTTRQAVTQAWLGRNARND